MVRVLCIHGVGGLENENENKLDWEREWRQTIENALPTAANIDFLDYDDLFNFPLNASAIATALWKLTASGVSAGVESLFGRERGLLGDFSSKVGWTAGMVVQWAGDAELRGRTRQRVLDKMNQFQPDIICAHSLGSLITYDTFIQGDGVQAIQGKTFVTFGSQIGNDFVKGIFGGRIFLPGVAFWYHLFNTHDWVFTAPIKNGAEPFKQVPADFRDPPVNHSALKYLGHANVTDEVWSALAQPVQARTIRTGHAAFVKANAVSHRALLVGINNYPDAANRLEGCVNDVYLMSAVLQESGFKPEDIRVVLDERATAAGILERLHWLLDGTQAGDQRFFFYSGHGAQLPGYGIAGKADRLHSSLVPYDFNWAPQNAIIDDDFDDLYSQLPYEARFIVMLDCCYSGGMVRDGGARVRGLNPPDDIRHRLLKWDAEHQMWVPRQLPKPNPDLAGRKYKGKYAGPTGSDRLLGRALGLRTLRDRAFNKVCKDLGHQGPYLPLIFEACKADQFSYEYRHGVTSYGAFTYSLATTLRRARDKELPITFAGLLGKVKQTLKDLHYDQDPSLLGPDNVVKLNIPWLSGT